MTSGARPRARGVAPRRQVQPSSETRDAAGAVGVEFAIAQDDGGGVVNPDLAVQRKGRRRQRENCCQKSVFHRNSGESSNASTHGRAGVGLALCRRS